MTVRLGYFALIFETSSKTALLVAVRRVDDDDVDLGGDERGDALHRVGRPADGSAREQAAVFIARGVGVLDALFDVLDGDQALEVALFVDDGQLFDAVLAQNFLRLFERGADGAP